MKIINTIKNIRLIIIEELIKIRYPNMKKFKTSILQYKKREEIRLLFFIYNLSTSKDKHVFSTNSAKTSSIDWFALTVISLLRLFSFWITGSVSCSKRSNLLFTVSILRSSSRFCSLALIWILSTAKSLERSK